MFNPTEAASFVTPSMTESVRRATRGAEGFAETLRLFLSSDLPASVTAGGSRSASICEAVYLRRCTYSNLQGCPSLV